MDLIDVYDQAHNALGNEYYNVALEKGLWHNTLKGFLYDKQGNVYFALSHENNKLTYTVGGYLFSGETVNTAFGRLLEAKTGLKVDTSDAEVLGNSPYRSDMEMEDGSISHLKAFLSICIDEFEGNLTDIKFPTGEYDAIVRFSAKEALDMFENCSGNILGNVMTSDFIEDKYFGLPDFHIKSGESYTGKFGIIMKKVLEKTGSNNN